MTDTAFAFGCQHFQYRYLTKENKKEKRLQIDFDNVFR